MITIRKANPNDASFIAQHAYRLLEFGPPAWRKPDWELMTKADAKHITNALMSDGSDKEVLMAEDESGKACGFLHMTLQTDYYTEEKQAHITDIVVIKEAEGKGVGRFLMEKADEWAREKKAKWITLNAFEGNEHARKVYEKSGYQVEWIRYLKLL
jgi:ribosomal protein S18 acetylase RimI-like enzyme